MTRTEVGCRVQRVMAMVAPRCIASMPLDQPGVEDGVWRVAIVSGFGPWLRRRVIVVREVELLSGQAEQVVRDQLEEAA